MTEPDPARARFFALGFIRLGGVAFAFLGISIVAKRWIEPAEVIGGLFLIMGAINVLALPVFLAKRWRTPKE